MLRHRIAMVLVGAALFCIACSGAQHSPAVGQDMALRVVTPGDYAPFATCTKTSPPRCEGFDVALIESYAAERGLRISWTLSSWSNLSEDLRGHDLAIGGITKRAARMQIGPFSDVLVRTGKQALMRCVDQKQFSTWEAIEVGARIVTNLGGGNETFARAHFSGDQIRVLPTNENVPKALLAGGADVFFTDGPEADLLARSHEELCIGLEGKLHDPFELAIWFFRDSQRLRDDFNRYLRSAIGRKRIRELRVGHRVIDGR